MVAQANELIDQPSTVFVCPITSAVQDGLPLRPIVDPQAGNGLRLRSQIMADKMVALPRDRIRQTIGRIDSGRLEQLDRALLLILGLAG